MLDAGAHATPPPMLPELLPEHASGEQRRVYDEIRHWSAVPMVALIYRHLATMPCVLEWAWDVLGPAMRAGLLQERAWSLATAATVPDVPRIPRAALRVAGIDAADETAIRTVLDAYNRANPVNIVAVRCLAKVLDSDTDRGAGSQTLPPWTPPPALPDLGAMTDPRAMSPDVQALASLLTDRDRVGAPSALWPSLYRHLAPWPAMLGYAGVLVPPRFAAIDEAAGRLRQQVDLAAAEVLRQLSPRAGSIEAPSPERRAPLQAALDSFTHRIPEMVVIGGLLRQAMPPADISR